MNSKELTFLLIKVAGAALIVFSIIKLSQTVPYFFSEKYTLSEITILAVSNSIIPVVFGLLLMFFPSTISSKVIGKQDNTALNNEYMFELEQIALSVLGVYLLFITISDITAHAVYIIEANKMIASGKLPGTTAVLGPERYGLLFATGIEFIMSIWLIFGSKGMVKLIRNIRGRNTF